MNRIKELATAKGITLRELANMIRVTDFTMARYISGEKIPTRYILLNLAKALETTPENIMAEGKDA